MGEQVRSGQVDLRKKRVKYLEMASIVGTVLDRKNFPKFAETLMKSNRDGFEKLCDAEEIPIAVRNELWDILTVTWKASGDEAPWLTGIS